jgi:hypothetical protein
MDQQQSSYLPPPPISSFLHQFSSLLFLPLPNVFGCFVLNSFRLFPFHPIPLGTNSYRKASLNSVGFFINIQYNTQSSFEKGPENGELPKIWTQTREREESEGIKRH